MSRNKKTFKSHRSFTMVELLAVITITAILLTITVSIVKVDSTKANASVVAGAISYAQAHAMGKQSSGEYTAVIYNQGNDKILIYAVDTNTTTSSKHPAEIIDTKKFAGNSLPKADFAFIFANNGTPYEGSNDVLDFEADDTEIADTFTTTDISSMISVKIVTVEDSADANNSIDIYVKPFTGKVTFYN